MSKHVLFIQGGGTDGYTADAELVASLRQALGASYAISYPELKTEESHSDFGWLKQIGDQLATLSDDALVVAHSLGASMLLKYLSENRLSSTKAYRIFLLAAPFWSGDDDWVQGLKLQDDFAQRLPPKCRLFFFHCRDDDEVPFEHLTVYRQKLPTATFCEIDQGGHQFDNSLDVVAKAINDLYD